MCVVLPRHSQLGFVVCVFVRSFSCPGLWCPCFCPPPLARDCGVCACASSFMAGVRGVCFCTHPSAFTLPVLAEVCGVCACALPRVFVRSLSSLMSMPRCFSFVHLLSWLGCVVLVLVPRHSWLGLGLPLVLECQWLVFCGLRVVGTLWCGVRSAGLRHQVAVVARHMVLCHRCGRQRASLACPVAPCLCAEPRPVRSGSMRLSESFCCGATIAVFIATCLVRRSPVLNVCGRAGHVEARREPGSWCPPAGQFRAGLAPRRTTWGPGVGWSLGIPSGVGLVLHVLRCFCVCGPGHTRVQFRTQFALRRCCRALHRGCFVWTPAPSLAGWRALGPRPICVC